MLSLRPFAIISFLGLSAASLQASSGGLMSAYRYRIRHHSHFGLPGNTTFDHLKREGSSRFTFYQTGLGACGVYSQPTDHIVALNTEQWDGGSHCFETISIKCGSTIVQAQIVDSCPGCPYNGLDFSESLFDVCGSEDQGTIYGEWSYGKDQPTTTSTSLSSTYSTETTPSASVLSVPKTFSINFPTPSSTELSSFMVPSSTVPASTSATSSALATAQTAAVHSCSNACDNSGNLNDINLAIIKLGTILVLA